MKFGRGLECIMHCHQKGRLAYCCQNLPLGFSMLCGLSFLDNSSLFKNFHCKKLTSIDSCLLFGQKDFSIGTCIKKLLNINNQSSYLYTLVTPMLHSFTEIFLKSNVSYEMLSNFFSKKCHFRWLHLQPKFSVTGTIYVQDF